ncbi:peroxiredoxin-like family protein [Sphingobacterium sp. Lzh-3]|uniref:peroxiredoxin-like family protein n=1 Tax=Sphingobacterium sp. Lzh-3 TaxID=3382150 RepID=UPI00398CD58E
MRKIISLVLAAFCFMINVGHAQQDIALSQDIPEMAVDISPLLIGELFPFQDLKDVNGQIVNMGTIISQKPTILVFYRGGWCPYCNLQLSGLQEIEKELLELGYQVVAVSTDKPENLQTSIDKGHLSYTLLSDADLSLGKKIGIVFRAPTAYHKFLPETSGGKNTDMLLPVPSVFILDKTGKIKFEYIEPNFKERISPKLLQAVAGALYESL